MIRPYTRPLVTLLVLLTNWGLVAPAFASGPSCRISFPGWLDATIRFDSAPIAVVPENEVNRDNPFSLSFASTGPLKRPKDPRSLDVWLWMDMCGPGRSHKGTPVQIQRTGVGKFRATNVYFVMAGPWEVKVQVGRDVRSCRIDVDGTF